MSVLHVENISAAYRRNTVLKNVSFTVEKGSLTGIVGPNGAGKSTLIKTLLNLHPPLSGQVYFFDSSLKRQKSRVGYVPQRGSVDWDFPTNALDVVLMGLYRRIGWLKWPKKKHKEKAMDALRKVGMEDYAKRQISQLSGGQQQRVFLARALVQDADLYFMDEPFAGVDAATERAIMTILKQLRADGKTVLVVHHDLQTVKDYFDHVLFLNKTIIAHGKTEEIFTASNITKAYGGAVHIIKEEALVDGDSSVD
ncbi:metal ABC transporter ATP-binding protein [Shouchella lehensis]|uniref:Metal ABC transporter ATP-binding protein n=1 Tax=Shouchella lehensis TaxID=300825 RepID=A0A4Y7WFG1_9BACI|nr:metal ABC transporter ATP-binding protein [Shouchella lehensis]MBG9785237.1 manganese ABC transporter ATP-binding protein [Shouchella lehensis]RQW18962.1 metal ABC transporter ATP-binding protein [Bacillus sp. C1-1]TES46682.1 metal ABC transporter ATP-binding protein [Shouchella lehensis]